MMEFMIKFENVVKHYRTTNVINGIDFEVKKGELVVLIGPSGCGKTTTLKMINKLIRPSSGKILIEGKNIAEEDTIELRRKIGYVIQQTGLFPHLTVKENIEIIPRLQKLPEAEINNKSRRLLRMVGLDPNVYLDRFPIQLSGGQNQRVGVARAFATDPEIILMDEPFSAVDPITRHQLQDELVKLQSKLKKTIVFVTHDMDEALKIADRICILNNGEIIQYDTPEIVLKNPINDFVSTFVGKNRIWSNPEFIRAKDIMLTNPVVTYPEVPILKVIENMRVRKIDSILVIDEDGKFVGSVRAERINNHVHKSQPVSELMRLPVATAHPYDSIVDLLKKTKQYKVSSIPVIDEFGILQGLITMSTLVTTLSQQFIEFEEDESYV